MNKSSTTNDKQHSSRNSSRDSWIAENAGLVSYLVAVCVLTAAIVAVYNYYLKDANFYLQYLELITRAGSQILTAMGEPNIIIRNELGGIEGRIVGGWEANVVVERGAGAFLLAAMLSFAIICWPAAWGKKLSGLVFGLLLVIGTNILRIVASLLVDLYYPLKYELMVENILPFTHALLAIAFFCFGRPGLVSIQRTETKRI